jgi:hypothetical protein
MAWSITASQLGDQLLTSLAKQSQATCPEGLDNLHHFSETKTLGPTRPSTIQAMHGEIAYCGVLHQREAGSCPGGASELVW